MKRICLFAGFNKNNKIEDYVVYYLKELSTVSEVYYMADNEISDEEKSKIMPYVKGAYGFNHKKYDFGSWQELINILGWEKISEYDELILANDSVFGPLYPIKELFEKIEKDKEWEVCGITEECSIQKEKNNYSINNFIQSYFLIIKNKVFMASFFQQFFHDYKYYPNKEDVVYYGEKKLSKLLLENKIKTKKLINDLYDPFKEWKKLITAGSPFIKKSKFINKEYINQYQTLYNYKNFIEKNTKYNVSFIDNYLLSNNKDIPYFSSFKYLLITIYSNIKTMRKKIFNINIKKYKKEIILFGIIILKKDYKKSIFNTVNL